MTTPQKICFLSDLQNLPKVHLLLICIYNDIGWEKHPVPGKSPSSREVWFLLYPKSKTTGGPDQAPLKQTGSAHEYLFHSFKSLEGKDLTFLPTDLVWKIFDLIWSAEHINLDQWPFLLIQRRICAGSSLTSFLEQTWHINKISVAALSCPYNPCWFCIFTSQSI